MDQKLTHHKKLANPAYIGAYSLNPGEERIVTIESVYTAKVFDPGSQREKECVIAKLVGEKPMILNATNRNTITELYDSPYIEHWAGKKIIIYIDKIVDKRTKKNVDCLRIRKIKPQENNNKQPQQKQIDQEKQKVAISDERFSNALKAIGAGTYTKKDLEDNFSLSDDQKKKLEEYINALINGENPESTQQLEVLS